MTAALWVFAGQSVATGGVASLILVAAAFVLVWRKVCGAMAVIALSALAGCILHAMSLV
jgi:hypothetical protein